MKYILRICRTLWQDIQHNSYSLFSLLSGASHPLIIQFHFNRIRSSSTKSWMWLWIRIDRIRIRIQQIWWMQIRDPHLECGTGSTDPSEYGSGSTSVLMVIIWDCWYKWDSSTKRIRHLIDLTRTCRMWIISQYWVVYNLIKELKLFRLSAV